MTELNYYACDGCDMPRLPEELNKTPDPSGDGWLVAHCDPAVVECDDYGKIRPCDHCDKQCLADSLHDHDIAPNSLICDDCLQNAFEWRRERRSENWDYAHSTF